MPPYNDFETPEFPDYSVSKKGMDTLLADAYRALLVRSVFLTVQGEMPLAGKSSLFLRLGGCNRGAKIDVNCSFCDTDFRVGMSRLLDPAQVLAALHKASPVTPPAVLVISGGEPLLQIESLNNFFSYLSQVSEIVLCLDDMVSAPLSRKVQVLESLIVFQDFSELDIYSEESIDSLIEWLLLFFGQTEVQFETNGDFSPKDLICGSSSSPRRGKNLTAIPFSKIHFVVSPKNRGPNMLSKWETGTLPDRFCVNRYSGHRIPVEFHFRGLVSADPQSSYYDLSFIEALGGGFNTRWLSPITPRNPCTTQREEYLNNVKRCMDYISTNPTCGLSIQTHAFIDIE